MHARLTFAIFTFAFFVVASACNASSQMFCTGDVCLKRTIVGVKKVNDCKIQLLVQQQVIPWNPDMPQSDLRDWMFNKSNPKPINWRNYGRVDCCKDRVARDMGSDNYQGAAIANEYCSKVGL